MCVDQIQVTVQLQCKHGNKTKVRKCLPHSPLFKLRQSQNLSLTGLWKLDTVPRALKNKEEVIFPTKGKRKTKQ